MAIDPVFEKKSITDLAQDFYSFRSSFKEESERNRVRLNTYHSNPGARVQNVPFYIELVDSSGRPKKLEYVDRGGTVIGLRLSINPSNMTVNMQKMVNRTQTMTGWIEDHWGDEIDTISIQGNTASFVYIPINAQGNTVTGRGVVGGGLTVGNRRDTATYKEFKNIIDVFNSNGCVFDTQGFVKERLYVMITYDYSSYMGFFESIDVLEDAINPFRFNYTITFKSERTIYSFGTRF